MRITVGAVFCCLVAIPSFAQRGGGHGGMGGGHAMGGGARASVGGGFRGAYGGAGIRGGGFHGDFHHGFNRGFGFRNRFAFGAPFLYSGFYGGFYDPLFWDYPSYYPSSYEYSPYPPGATTYGYAGEAPMLVINQGYQPEQPMPMVREYPPPPPRPEASQYESPLYLLALKDGNIRAVLAYWVEGDAVHYVTMDHENKQTPLNTIDRELSERLNRERRVTFQLPR